MKIKILVSFLLILFCSIISFGQGKPLWVTSFENNFKQKETEWKIEEIKEFSSQNGIYNYFYVLKSSNYQSNILINKLADAPNRVENAVENAFKSVVAIFDKDDFKTKKMKVENFGDEGFIWVDVKVENSIKTMMLFRKRDVFVQIYAPSEIITKRFGQLVSEQMP